MHARAGRGVAWLRRLRRPRRARAPRAAAPAVPHAVLALRAAKLDGDRVRYRALLTLASGQEKPIAFWVRRGDTDAITDRADPFLLGALPYAMLEGAPLFVRGAPVSPSLLRNLEEFQRVWTTWRPGGFFPVAIHAEQKAETGAASDEAVTAYSSGVDSTYTVYRHLVAPETGRERRLRAGLLIHGFDLLWTDYENYAELLEQAQRVVAGLDFELIPVRTSFGYQPQARWEDGQGLHVAAVLSLFSGRFGSGLISSTGSYRDLLLPWGTNALTDPMLGSRSFEIVHFGASRRYVDKLRELSQWPGVLANLRFCHRPPKQRNCGRCKKCVQVGLLFRSLGLQPPLLRPLDDATACQVLEQILAAPEPVNHERMCAILAGAEQLGIDAPWVELIRRELPRFRVPGLEALQR